MAAAATLSVGPHHLATPEFQVTSPDVVTIGSGCPAMSRADLAVPKWAQARFWLSATMAPIRALP
jgi:hypothetical protein